MSSGTKKILIADSDKNFIESIQNEQSKYNQYSIEIATSGEECLQKLQQKTPDIAVLDLMLPGMHGIELLRIIRNTENLKSLPVIISCAFTMIQNYRIALAQGANDFLQKPCSPEDFFKRIDAFFAGETQPHPFQPVHVESNGEAQQHLPYETYLKFYGTRGSLSVSGKDFIKYGGNTCSLEVRDKDTVLVVDTGSGVFHLGQKLMQEKQKTIDIFLSHLHWDHISGFPFFHPLYNPNCAINVWTPVGFEGKAQNMLKDVLNYTFFPMNLGEMPAHIQFKELRPGEENWVGNIKIETHYTCHPCCTVCFKLTIGDKVIGYVTDNEMYMGVIGGDGAPFNSDVIKHEFSDSFVDFFKGCDLMVHEAQYLTLEYPKKIGWGHSSAANATRLIKEIGTPRWIATHHDPLHTDQDLDMKYNVHRQLLNEWGVDCEFQMAFDGMVVPL